MIVRRIQLPDPSIKLSDLTGELIKEYGQPTRSDATSLGWYREALCKTPTLGLFMRWPPPPDADGKRVVSGGYIMTDKDIMVDPISVTTPEIGGPQLPNGLMGPPAREPMRLDGKPPLPLIFPTGCGTALFAHVNSGALFISAVDKLWLDGLFYEGQKSQSESVSSKIEGILNK
jgi:hypothetical protein